MLRTSINQGIRSFNSNMQSQIKCRRLEGKVAVVTASTEGIGLAIAKRLAQEGAKVMLSSRKEANVQSAIKQLQSQGLNVSGTVCHVSKSEDRKNLFGKTKAEFGGIDILVSNAAVNPDVGTVLECAENVWDKIMDVNVKSTYLLMKESLPYLRERKSSSIVVISSIAGYKPFSLLGAYSVSKTALFGLCKAAAEDLASEGIRVNCIAPGIIETKFSNALYQSETAKDVSLSMIPMNRFGTPDEIASVAAFLTSDDASYVTGETIVASGGISARL